MQKIPETKIGALRQEQRGVAQLHCFCAEAVSLSVELLDERGRAHLSVKKALSAGIQKVSIKLGHLPPGEYNAWINLGEVSGIRPLSIDGGVSLGGRFKEWLKK